MAERKTPEQKLQELEKKMEQLKAQKRAIQARQNKAERTARTHRLIEIGAEIEAALGYSLDTVEARKAVGKFLREQEARGKWVTKAIEKEVKIEGTEETKKEPFYSEKNMERLKHSIAQMEDNSN